MRSKAAKATGHRRTSPPTAMARLRLVLREAGIGEERFASVALVALAGLRTAPAADPGTQFSEQELAALRSGGADLGPARSSDPDPAADTAARFAALLADSADVPEVSRLLGVTPARVRQRAQDRTLFAIREGDEWRFPRAQFEGRAQLRGLSAVTAALPGDLHPVAAWRFLNEPDPDLELADGPVSPVAWLRSGGPADPVVAIAREL